MSYHDDSDSLIGRWQEAEQRVKALTKAILRHREKIYGITQVDFEPDLELYTGAGVDSSPQEAPKQETTHAVETTP